jgi:uncharacterized membrane protein
MRWIPKTRLEQLEGLPPRSLKGGLARELLEERHASGKITREQYEKLLRELGWDD